MTAEIAPAGKAAGNETVVLDGEERVSWEGGEEERFRFRVEKLGSWVRRVGPPS